MNSIRGNFDNIQLNDLTFKRAQGHKELKQIQNRLLSKEPNSPKRWAYAESMRIWTNNSTDSVSATENGWEQQLANSYSTYLDHPRSSRYHDPELWNNTDSISEPSYWWEQLQADTYSRLADHPRYSGTSEQELWNDNRTNYEQEVEAYSDSDSMPSLEDITPMVDADPEVPNQTVPTESAPTDSEHDSDLQQVRERIANLLGEQREYVRSQNNQYFPAVPTRLMRPGSSGPLRPRVSNHPRTTNGISPNLFNHHPHNQEFQEDNRQQDFTLPAEILPGQFWSGDNRDAFHTLRLSTTDSIPLGFPGFQGVTEIRARRLAQIASRPPRELHEAFPVLPSRPDPSFHGVSTSSRPRGFQGVPTSFRPRLSVGLAYRDGQLGRSHIDTNDLDNSPSNFHQPENRAADFDNLIIRTAARSRLNNRRRLNQGQRQQRYHRHQLSGVTTVPRETGTSDEEEEFREDIVNSCREQ